MNALLIGFKHFKTTCAGIASVLAGLGLFGAGLNALVESGEVKTEVFAAGCAAIATGVGLIFAKDADKSNAPAPAATATKVGLVALLLVLPGLVLAQTPPPVAEPEPPPESITEPAPVTLSFRGPLGSMISPSVSFAPMLVSFKDGSVTTGPDAGAGIDVTWNTGMVKEQGASLHLAMRDTTNGVKPMVSAFYIVPWLSYYTGIRPGVMYQFGGGAAPYANGFMFGIGGAANIAKLFASK